MPAKAGIHVCRGFKLRAMKYGYVYIMTNGPSGTPYIGVTSDIAAKIVQHRIGTGSDFCARYGLKRLVYIERHDSILDAIAREKATKAWRRNWKLDLLGRANPGWDDLFNTLNA